MFKQRPIVPFKPYKLVLFLNVLSAIIIIITFFYSWSMRQPIIELESIISTPTFRDYIDYIFFTFGEPFIALFFFVILSIISKRPHLFNYPVEITERNAVELYKIANLFITIIVLEMIVIFSLPAYRHSGLELGIWYIWIVFGVPIFTALIFALTARRVDRRIHHNGD